VTKFALGFAFVTMAAAASFAGQQENFNACAANDASWMSRWGNYVVSFDRSSAYDICRKQAWPQPSIRVSARQTGCYIDGAWADAGFYCEVLDRR
jgi:uncharacterized protein (DUF2147 family)